MAGIFDRIGERELYWDGRIVYSCCYLLRIVSDLLLIERDG